MFKRAIYKILAFLYFILFFSVVILAHIFSDTRLGNWFKKMVNALAPE